MSRSPSDIPDHCIHQDVNAKQQSNLNTDRLASLAVLTMSRQTPGLALPSLEGVPTSYSHTTSNDKALKLARSLAVLGFGSVEIWERNNGNLSTFIRNSLNAWLESLGALEFRGNVGYDFAIVEELDIYGCSDNAEHKENLFILLETSDGCGYITIGEQIKQLEREEGGLGRAYYSVLMGTLYSWIRVYDILDAEYFVERWKESVEMEVEYGEGNATDAENLDDYCKSNGITFPDLEGAIPSCLLNKERVQKGRAQRNCVSLLKKHRRGLYHEWIEPVLAMAAVREPPDKQPTWLRELVADGFDDGPLPNWIVGFEDHDPISQAFDEESQNMYEASHQPLWVRSFDPGDVKDVRNVLDYVRRFVEVNRQLVILKQVLEKGSSNGSTNRPELDDELRAA